MNGNKGNYQIWLAVGAILLFIGIPQLGTGSTMGLITGLVFIAGSAGGFWQAFAEKRRAEAEEQAELSRRAATEAPPEPDRPQ
ncbi:hypothetical protein [Kineosporia babensis]|uniref:Uncharacterized protein n=1 Tax=Kineosporia babensis TaxID=499548 RepID=A0A9X1NMV3_9ACTN|nr:hypothetical protein [Kineosporia babensis]MCD5317093.1 hypothetical protein [Kineosporia babensis]